jgi:hypothetical protein
VLETSSVKGIDCQPLSGPRICKQGKSSSKKRSSFKVIALRINPICAQLDFYFKYYKKNQSIIYDVLRARNKNKHGKSDRG